MVFLDVALRMSKLIGFFQILIFRSYCLQVETAYSYLCQALSIVSIAATLQDKRASPQLYNHTYLAYASCHHLGIYYWFKTRISEYGATYEGMD